MCPICTSALAGISYGVYKLAGTPKFPNSNIATSSNINPTLLEKVKEFILGVCTFFKEVIFQIKSFIFSLPKNLFSAISF